MFLLVMGWIIFYQLKLMKYYTEFADFTEQADSPYDRVIISISILLIITFLIITVLTWFEFSRLNRKNTIPADQKSGSGLSKTHTGISSGNSKDKNNGESQNEIYEAKRQKLIICFEKEISTHSCKSEKFVGEKILSCISKTYEITHAEIFIIDRNVKKKTTFRLLATYAIHITEDHLAEFDLGEGLIGQVAQSGKYHYTDKLPEGFLTVRSGLGKSDPNCLLVLPWKDQKGKTFAVIELASFRPFSAHDIKLLESVSENLIPFFNLV
jgi:hypothetical protein